jgi:hypothetical protein
MKIIQITEIDHEFTGFSSLQIETSYEYDIHYYYQRLKKMNKLINNYFKYKNHQYYNTQLTAT